MVGPNRALLVKEKWAKLLLDGRKTWEVRGCSTRKRGVIALAVSGTGMLFGEICLTDSVLVGKRTSDGRLVRGGAAEDNFIGNDANASKHCIEDLGSVKYPKIYAWVMANPVIYECPRPFVHTHGCVKWVKLDNAKEKPKARPSKKSLKRPCSKKKTAVKAGK